MVSDVWLIQSAIIFKQTPKPPLQNKNWAVKFFWSTCYILCLVSATLESQLSIDPNIHISGDHCLPQGTLPLKSSSGLSDQNSVYACVCVCLCMCVCIKTEKKKEMSENLRELKIIFKSTIYFRKHTNW